MLAPWYDVAEKELMSGIAEIPGPDASQRIREYLATVGFDANVADETNWCSAFAKWCMMQALGESAKVTTINAMARSWSKWARECTIQRAAVCVLWRESPHSQWGHVGYVADYSSNYVSLMAGNQGNRVSIQAFPRSRIISTRWPQ